MLMMMATVMMFWCAGVRHGRGAIQRNAVRPSAGWKHGRDILHWQRGSVRHLLPYPQADHSHLRWPQPPCLCNHVWCHHLSPLPRPGRNSTVLSLEVVAPLLAKRTLAIFFCSSSTIIVRSFNNYCFNKDCLIDEVLRISTSKMLCLPRFVGWFTRHSVSANAAQCS